MLKRYSLPALLVALLVVLVAATGCGQEKMISLPDTTGAYHIVVPESWQHQLANGYIGLYVSKQLPTTVAQAADFPSITILTTTTASTTPVPVELTRLIEMRAAGRGWKSKTVSTPTSAMIGNRPAYMSTVSGTDANGTKFQGKFFVGRTSGREVFIAAISTPDKWPAFSKQVDQLLKDWYWQLPDTSNQLPGTGTSKVPRGVPSTSTPKK